MPNLSIANSPPLREFILKKIVSNRGSQIDFLNEKIEHLNHLGKSEKYSSQSALNSGAIRKENFVDFSIVLINFNSLTYIEICLERLRSQIFSGSSEIVVVNNLSTDGSLEILKKQSGLTLINPGKNIGYSRGNNLGISKTNGKYILCLNFDCLLNADFLQKVYDAFEAMPQVGMISGKLYKLIDMQPTMYLDSCGIDFTTLIPADRGEWQYDKCQYDRETKIFGPSGAAGCYRRKALEEVVYRKTQYFDEQMFTYCEDIDLAWRLNLAGWEGLFLPDAIAYHERGATRKSSIWKRAGYYAIGFRNRFFTILKNLRREDIKGRLKKIFRQEWRFLSSWCGKSPPRWAIAAYIILGLAGLILRPSFIVKRHLVHRYKKGNHLDLLIDIDFWQKSYEQRRAKPVQLDQNLENTARIQIRKNPWLVSSQGFVNESWENESFFRGRFKVARGFIEIHIPEEFQSNLKKWDLYVELQTSSNVTTDIEIISSENKSARTDWQIFPGGRTLVTFDLSRMDMSAGAENIKAWQKPWRILRAHFASGPGCEIIIHDLFVCGCLEEISNEKLNFYECRNLPIRMESKPVLIYAELCTYCNMNCRMCGRTVHGVKDSDQGMMKKETFERLIEIFSPGSNLAMFGRGETLMHPDFPYLLKLAKERGMKVTFNSNGKALREKIARAMVEYGQDSITISCSAGTPETYEAIHCGGKWVQLWGNIVGLQKLKEQFVSGRPSIYIEFVSQMDNISELPRLVRRAIEYKLTGVIVIDMVAHSDELEKQRTNTPENIPIANKYYEQALEVLDELRNKNPYFELRLPSSYNALTKKFSSGETEERLKKLGKEHGETAECFTNKNMCLEPWQTFYVKFNGTIAPCVITNRNLGDLNKQDAMEIWNGLQFQKFRSRMRSENKPFECLRCHLFPGPQRYDKSLNNAEEYEAL